MYILPNALVGRGWRLKLFWEILGDRMLGMAIASGSHVLLTWFYDVCDGFHAKKRVSEHLTTHPYFR